MNSKCSQQFSCTSLTPFFTPLFLAYTTAIASQLVSLPPLLFNYNLFFQQQLTKFFKTCNNLFTPLIKHTNGVPLQREQTLMSLTQTMTEMLHRPVQSYIWLLTRVVFLFLEWNKLFPLQECVLTVPTAQNTSWLAPFHCFQSTHITCSERQSLGILHNVAHVLPTHSILHFFLLFWNHLLVLFTFC